MPEDELRAAILERLDRVQDPCSVAGGTPMGLTEMGLVDGVDIDGDRVAVRLRLTSPFCHLIGFLQSETIEQVGSLPGVGAVTVTADQGLDWSPELIAPAARERRRLRLEAVSRGAAPGPTSPTRAS